MLCLIARFEDQVLRFPLPEGPVTVGASSSSDICLPFPGVSRTHARIIPIQGGLRFEDLGSKNLLIVGEERVDEVNLTVGEELQIGRVFLVIEDGSTSDVELALTTSGTARSESSDLPETDPIHLSHERPWRTPALAIKCIREIEADGKRGLGKRISKHLKKAREALRAMALLILDANESGEIAITHSAGSLPDDGMLDALGTLIASSKLDGRPRGETIRGSSVLLSTTGKKGSRRGLALVLGDSERTPEQWETDFFEFHARRFVGWEPAAVPAETDSADRELAIPEGMIVGQSAAMRGLLRQVAATVHSAMDVLLWGETGTGKELFAHMIHASGPTADGPFVAINCAAIPSELLEAELFGVQGRVATGVDPRPGLFLEANGGTMFLDEIGELAPQLQAKLLRVLQEREVLSLGASRPKKIRVRIVSSSNSDLRSRVEHGEFRADLYYRLRGLQFHIPPLRERREDMADLVLAFVERAAGQYKKRIDGVSKKALQILTRHDWPGNVRELKSEVERAVLVCPNGGALTHHAQRTRDENGALGRLVATFYFPFSTPNDHSFRSPPEQPIGGDAH